MLWLRPVAWSPGQVDTDDMRLRLAQKAEDMSALDFAATLLAGLSDLSLFDEIILRYTEHFQLETLPEQCPFARYGKGVRDWLIADSEIRNTFGGFLFSERLI